MYTNIIKDVNLKFEEDSNLCNLSDLIEALNKPPKSASSCYSEFRKLEEPVFRFTLKEPFFENITKKYEEKLKEAEKLKWQFNSFKNMISMVDSDIDLQNLKRRFNNVYKKLVEDADKPIANLNKDVRQLILFYDFVKECNDFNDAAIDKTIRYIVPLGNFKKNQDELKRQINILYEEVIRWRDSFTVFNEDDDYSRKHTITYFYLLFIVYKNCDLTNPKVYIAAILWSKFYLKKYLSVPFDLPTPEELFKFNIPKYSKLLGDDLVSSFEFYSKVKKYYNSMFNDNNGGFFLDKEKIKELSESLNDDQKINNELDYLNGVFDPKELVRRNLTALSKAKLLADSKSESANLKEFSRDVFIPLAQVLLFYKQDDKFHEQFKSIEEVLEELSFKTEISTQKISDFIYKFLLALNAIESIKNKVIGDKLTTAKASKK